MKDRKELGAGGGLLGIEGDEDGDFGEGGEAVVEFYIAGLEQTVGAGFHQDDRTDGKTGREDAAEAGGDEAFDGVGAGKDVEWDELDDAAGGAEGGVESALVTDRAGVAFDDGGEADGLAADEIDGSRVGENLADAADDAAAEDDGSAHGEFVIVARAAGPAAPTGARPR